MKNLSFLLALLLIAATAKAQSDHPKAFIGVGGGMAMPLGDFGSTDGDNNDEAAYATNGNFIDLNAGYRFANNFGISVTMRNQTNTANLEELRTQMAEDLPPGVTVTAHSDIWRRRGAMVGLFGVLPIGVEKRMALEFRGMAGFMNAIRPEKKYTFTPGGESLWLKADEANAMAPAYLAGMAFRVNFGPRIALSLTTDYLVSSHEFKNVKSSDNLGNTTYKDFNHSIETFNVGMGFAYRFF